MCLRMLTVLGPLLLVVLVAGCGGDANPATAVVSGQQFPGCWNSRENERFCGSCS